MQYFSEIGDFIQRAWAKTNRDEEAFPDIAQQALAESPPPHDLPEAVINDLLTGDRDQTRQFAPTGTFGEPGVTQYHDDEFVIDVYFWNNAIPAIHNHPFCGCFTILRGRSLHDVYRFEHRENLGSTVQVGKLSAERLSWLAAGDVVPFSLSRYPLIHSLVHVTNPAISMVIRTTRTIEYYRYFPPYLAISMDALNDRHARQIKMFRWLKSAGDPSFIRRLHQYLSTVNFETSIRTLSALFDPQINDELINVIRKRHGKHADLILPAIGESINLQTQNNYRQQFSSDETRTVLSVLMCAKDRTTVLRLLDEAFPDDGALSVLERLEVLANEDAETRQSFARLVDGTAHDDVWQESIFRALTLEESAM
ncbi:MAG: hypothetical protein KDB00_05405 [Planctomycetales bacterium]|nr:hypothetical protein [Planctomycetales bacterium]